MKKDIKVKVNMPTTAEGMEIFRAAMAQANTLLLVGALNKVDAPLHEKKAYIASLGGHAPWGHTHQRSEAHVG